MKKGEQKRLRKAKGKADPSTATEADDPYERGADAGAAGGSETDNPYPPATDAHLSWNDGWASAQGKGEDDD